jgi:hypothetical protein
MKYKRHDFAGTYFLPFKGLYKGCAFSDSLFLPASDLLTDRGAI